MTVEASILKSVRSAVGLDDEDSSFDSELLMHINGSIMILHQNGIGMPIHVEDVDTVWEDFKNPMQVDANSMFSAAKTFIFIKTKILFDPPPPSTIKYMAEAADEYLWRLRESFDVGLSGVIVDGDVE